MLSPHPELEWKLTYVGSAADEKLDQGTFVCFMCCLLTFTNLSELDSVLVGPVNVGRSKFVFQVC
jgi:hypothetical protein